MPRHQSVLAAAIVCALAFMCTPGMATAAKALSCGDVVTQSVTLTRSLVGCADAGLVVGADGITINLAGHTIRGTGADTARVGIEAVDRTDVTIKGGRIAGFSTGAGAFTHFPTASGSKMVTIKDLTVRDTVTGIQASSSADAPVFVDVSGNTIFDSMNGIVAFAVAGRVARNTITGLSDGGTPGDASTPRGVGIYCRDGFYGPTDITDNWISDSDTGILTFFCGSNLIGNDAVRNTYDGIYRDRSGGLVQDNRVSRNGRLGITAYDSHGLFLRNITNFNGSHGLAIGDSNPGHGPLHTVTGHTANGNGDSGIYSYLDGVIDGGRNRAQANLGPAQCVGLTCR